MTNKVKKMLDRLLAEAKGESHPYPETPEGNASYNVDIHLLLKLLPDLILMWDCWKEHVNRVSNIKLRYFTEIFKTESEGSVRDRSVNSAAKIGLE